MIVCLIFGFKEFDCDISEIVINKENIILMALYQVYLVFASEINVG
jgi:hypothetical protein